MIVFAAGNKYKVLEGSDKIRSATFKDGKTLWYVSGYRWIKSKQQFSKTALIHCVGEWEPKPVDTNEE